MAGLLPERRTREEIEAANRKLLRRHQAALNTWLRDYHKRVREQVAEWAVRKGIRP